MLFTSKNFIFSDFMWKKIFAPGNSGGLAPTVSHFLYGPIKNMRKSFIFLPQYLADLVTFTEEILYGKPQF